MLTEVEKGELLSVAKKAIAEYIKSGKISDFTIKSPTLINPQGAFVSLHKDGDLRGCIGFVESAKPLWEVVRDAAIAAATQDPRFAPLDESELDKITIEISVLSALLPIKSPDEIEVGKHGLVVRRLGFSGLLLPQVATQYSMDKYQFLAQTCIKAGLSQDAWKEDINIYTFTTEVFHYRHC